jgi:hypothetical protein
MPVSRSLRPIEVSRHIEYLKNEHWWSQTISRRWVAEMALTCRNARNWSILTHINYQIFLPDTAVRWLGQLAFTAASRSTLNARRSPAGSGRRCFPPMNVARMFDGKSATARMPSRIHG